MLLLSNRYFQAHETMNKTVKHETAVLYIF